MHIDHRTPLRRAVDKLIADGKVKQDKDLQEIFDLSKSTISAYLNNPKPGKRFVNDFEKKFGISLKEFEKDEVQFTTNYDKLLIEALQGQLNLLGKLDDLQKRVDLLETNLKQNHEYLKAVMAQIRAASRLAVERHAGADKKKMLEERRTLDKYVGEYLAEQ